MVSALKQHQVKTKRPEQKGPGEKGTTPRLPHERDESEDSQESKPRDDIRQAYKDLENGLVNTDLRGEQGVDEVTSPPENDAEAGRARKNAPHKDEGSGA